MTGMNILPIRIQIFWVHRICSCWVRDLYLKTNVFSHPPFNFPHPYSLLSSSSLTHSHLSQSFLSPALIPHNQYTFPHFPHSLFRKHVTTWPYTLVMQPLFSLTFVTYRRFPLTIISLYCSFSSPFIFLLVIYRTQFPHPHGWLRKYCGKFPCRSLFWVPFPVARWCSGLDVGLATFASLVPVSVMTLPLYFWDRWPSLAGNLSWDVTTT